MKIDNVVDIITNSSSELFIFDDDFKDGKEVKEYALKIFKTVCGIDDKSFEGDASREDNERRFVMFSKYYFDIDKEVKKGVSREYAEYLYEEYQQLRNITAMSPRDLDIKLDIIEFEKGFKLDREKVRELIEREIRKKEEEFKSLPVEDQSLKKHYQMTENNLIDLVQENGLVLEYINPTDNEEEIISKIMERYSNNYTLEGDGEFDGLRDKYKDRHMGFFM